MSIFNKVCAIFSVGTKKIVENTGLTEFNNEVDLMVTEGNLAETKAHLVDFKVDIRTKEKQLDSLNDEIGDFKAKMQEMVNFYNTNTEVSEQEKSKVKDEARRIYERIGEKEKQAQDIADEISNLKQYESKIEAEIERFEKTISQGKNSIKTQMAKQKIADSKIRLADSAEKLIGGQTALSESISEKTLRKEAEADIKFENLLNSTSESRDAEDVSQIMNKGSRDSEFEKMFGNTK